MANRSQVPKWIKRGKGKVPIGKGQQPMSFKKAKAREKRVDTGKKLIKRHHTPNYKY